MAVHADPVPPEAAQLAQVAGERDPALEEVREAALVAVEAGLDRDVGEVRVAAEQAGDGMRAGAAGATDEDGLAVLAHAGWRS